MLECGIDVGAAQTYSAAVEGGVGTPVDDELPVGGFGDPVAVGPHPGKAFEVGARVSRAVWVVPQRHRHRRERPGDHHFTDFADHAGTGIIPGLHRYTELGALQSTQVDWFERIGTDEGTADFGATGVRSEVDVGFDVLVHPLPGGVGEW